MGIRKIDSKYEAHCESDGCGVDIVKASNGQAIPEDEPMFLFRGRDRLAVHVLIAYRRLCIEDGCLPEHMASLDAMIEKFDTFAGDHPERMKQPGITRGA